MRPNLPNSVKCLVVAVLALLVFPPLPAAAREDGGAPLLMEQRLLESAGDLPHRAALAGLRADTVWYGDYEVIGGVYYARRSTNLDDVAWTFDRGNGPSGTLPPGVIEDGEGWSARDMTANDALYFRVIDNTLDLGLGVTPPIIAGARTLWVGADKPQADAMCWPCGAGYGNNWCQRIVSEPLAYNGSGNVTLSMLYFNDTEECYDGTQIYLLRSDNTEMLLNAHGECPDNPFFAGGFTGSVGQYSAPATYTRAITQAEIGAAQAIRIIIEMKGDGGYSDEDCGWDTVYGPFGTDNVSLTGGGINEQYDFETGLQGWTPGYCVTTGSYVGIEDIECYTILDPCQCRLAGNVMEFHANPCDENPTHPIGQHEQVYSPICDDSDNTSLKEIFMQFDMYAEMPRECGVLFRPGWRYYPWTCEITGAQGWSPRVGQDTYNYFGSDPICSLWRWGGTTLGTAGNPLPSTAQKFVAILELLGDCAAFSIDPCTCAGGNFTPLIDNIAVGVTAGVAAPIINFEVGCRFQDCGSYPSMLFDPRGTVPANIVFDKYLGNPDKPTKAGDSLVVTGPLPGNDPNKRWESRMWWRVAKRGSFQADRSNNADTRYKIWKERVADGRLIDRPIKPQFTFGWMDSAQVGPSPQRNKFVSSFREDDDDYRGEGNAETEMIWDDVLVPGTRIDYFITSNYIATPNLLYYLPDTSGGFFYEFEALPGIRTANVPNCGGAGMSFCAYQPATLFIDMYNAGSQFYVENALRTLLNGLPLCTQEDGCTIPQERNWDRYDYLDAASSWNCPFGRSNVPGSNAGMTLQQILGYRAILANTGTYSAGTTEEEDWSLLAQWLVSPDCNANTNRQALLLNGDKPGEILLNLQENGVPFLTDVLQATLLCDAFNGFTQDPDCAPENSSYCVRLLPVAGGPFGTLVDVDAWGSFCPNSYGLNVFTPHAGGAGNRIYSAETPPKTMQYEQVVTTNLAVGANYKTVLDGASWHHMTKRNPNPPGGDPMEYCPRDVGSIVEGAYNEIRAALRWSFDVTNDAELPKLANVRDLATCQGTWSFAAGVDDAGLARVNRLFQNEPNPFQARSTITFSLAQTGRVEILVYDVNGRLVRTLVDGPVEAGSHQVVWDGTNDSGHRVGAGVYWTQMKAGSYTSNKKMVTLR